MKTHNFSISGKAVYFFSFFIYLLVSGCNSSSSESTTTTTKLFSLGTSVKNVPLTAGVESQIKYTVTIPGDISTSGDISAQGDFSVNVAKTLENITLSASPITKNTSRFETLRLLAYILVKDAFAATEETAQVTAYVSHAGDPNVCASSYRFGPYSVTGMIGGALTSDTESVTPTEPAINISNSGSFEICIVTIPPINAYLTVTGVNVDFQPCEPPSVDIVGMWTGTYECTNFGIGDDPLTSINLTVSQNDDGSYQYISDDGAVYNGHLCGNKFKFSGGLADSFTESGTMIADGNDATKTSNWLSTDNITVGGSCSDTLSKI